MKRWERKVNDETKGPVPLNTILQDWFQSSSIDGVGHAGRARNRCTRVLWVIVLLVGLALTIYHIYYILHEYYHRPIRTTVALSSEKKVKKKCCIRIQLTWIYFCDYWILKIAFSL